ncbi:MAG: 16S rRNA (cytidine(1402)-2'-O)-methyltransferase [Bacteroidia bacterium]
MLYLVPTPIGNLEDITHRAIRILKEADVILAEDTRTTKILLNHYGIEKKIFSHHAFNEHHTTPEIIKMLSEGKIMALVTDAGTPGISDPGFYLVRECIKNTIKIECLPGATAFVPALINSGLPCDKFCFEGFLPTKKGRKTAINNLKEETRTMIFYESPFRLIKTLEAFTEAFGAERKASVSRELTKMFEETLRGTLQELITYFNFKKVKGEIVIVVGGK